MGYHSVRVNSTPSCFSIRLPSDNLAKGLGQHIAPTKHRSLHVLPSGLPLLLPKALRMPLYSTWDMVVGQP